MFYVSFVCENCVDEILDLEISFADLPLNKCRRVLLCSI